MSARPQALFNRSRRQTTRPALSISCCRITNSLCGKWTGVPSDDEPVAIELQLHVPDSQDP
jgi:hypothetical protein